MAFQSRQLGQQISPLGGSMMLCQKRWHFLERRNTMQPQTFYVQHKGGTSKIWCGSNAGRQFPLALFSNDLSRVQSDAAVGFSFKSCLGQTTVLVLFFNLSFAECFKKLAEKKSPSYISCTTVLLSFWRAFIRQKILRYTLDGILHQERRSRYPFCFEYQ